LKKDYALGKLVDDQFKDSPMYKPITLMLTYWPINTTVGFHDSDGPCGYNVLSRIPTKREFKNWLTKAVSQSGAHGWLPDNQMASLLELQSEIMDDRVSLYFLTVDLEGLGYVEVIK